MSILISQASIKPRSELHTARDGEISVPCTDASTLQTREQYRQLPKKYTSDIFKECDLYVTIEPCIMCASLLRQYEIRKVYFGASNDRFGGTGGVLNIHKDGCPEPHYEVSGGWLREEAIMLLRGFYVQENGKGTDCQLSKECHTNALNSSRTKNEKEGTKDQDRNQAHGTTQG
jgi:pyrimidine deaminase RibD-like protein